MLTPSRWGEPPKAAGGALRRNVELQLRNTSLCPYSSGSVQPTFMACVFMCSIQGSFQLCTLLMMKTASSAETLVPREETGRTAVTGLSPELLA
jgi:hypothetical protein